MNGLSDRTELEITVTPTIREASTSRAYVAHVLIGSKSAENFGFDIVVGDSGATYDWNVTGAKAVR